MIPPAGRQNSWHSPRFGCRSFRDATEYRSQAMVDHRPCAIITGSQIPAPRADSTPPARQAEARHFTRTPRWSVNRIPHCFIRSSVFFNINAFERGAPSDIGNAGSANELADEERLHSSFRRETGSSVLFPSEKHCTSIPLCHHWPLGCETKTVICLPSMIVTCSLVNTGRSDLGDVMNSPPRKKPNTAMTDAVKKTRSFWDIALTHGQPLSFLANSKRRARVIGTFEVGPEQPYSFFT